MLDWLEQTGSTNAALAANAADKPHGYGLAARRQTAGRGRLGRSWVGARDNLFLSVLVRGVAARDLPRITLGAGVVVVRAVGGDFGLKWPNDVLDRQGRKLCGVLCEASWGNGDLDHVIVGVGVNVASAPPGVNATCLRDHGIELGVEALAEAIRAGIAGLRPERVLDDWRAHSFTLGRRVSIGGITGIAEDLASDGALRIRTPRGVETVRTGDLGFTGT